MSHGTFGAQVSTKKLIYFYLLTTIYKARLKTEPSDALTNNSFIACCSLVDSDVCCGGGAGPEEVVGLAEVAAAGYHPPHPNQTNKRRADVTYLHRTKLQALYGKAV